MIGVEVATASFIEIKGRDIVKMGTLDLCCAGVTREDMWDQRVAQGYDKERDQPLTS